MLVTTSSALTNALKFGDVNQTCLEVAQNCSENCPSDCYTGKGAEVQAIFALFFVVPISITTIIFGILADYHEVRLRILAIALAGKPEIYYNRGWL